MSRDEMMLQENSVFPYSYQSHMGSVAAGNILGLVSIGVFLLWAHWGMTSLIYHTREDKIIENLTALFFLLASIAMGVAVFRHPLKKSPFSKLRLLFMVGWVLLFFVFAGEEISWCQRIFDIPTPGFLKDNLGGQDELNVHNIAWVDQFMGGKFRWLSIMVLTTGLLMPLAKLVKPLRRLFTRFGMPVVQLHYISFFLGGYLFTKFTYDWIGPQSAEIREFLFSVGYFLFSAHGAVTPQSLLDCPKKGSSSAK